MPRRGGSPQSAGQVGLEITTGSVRWKNRDCTLFNEHNIPCDETGLASHRRDGEPPEVDFPQAFAFTLPGGASYQCAAK